MFNYIYPKIKYRKNEISFFYLFFENGDFVEIKGSEIVNLSINTYDKLIISREGYSPVAQSGYIKLNICNKQAFKQFPHYLYNEDEFMKNRKLYIENRCVTESRITEIWFFDRYYQSNSLYCEIKARIEEEFLILEILEQPQMGTYANKNHNVSIANVKQENIYTINFDFENCENFVVYDQEIKEINFLFDDKLHCGCRDLHRKIVGGYVRIQLDENLGLRQGRLFNARGVLRIGDFEKRLCYKKRTRIHNICNLSIKYDFNRFGAQRIEFFHVDDVKPNEEIEKLEKEEEKTGLWTYFFEGGHSKMLDDNSIIIAFGKTSKNTITKVANKN